MLFSRNPCKVHDINHGTLQKLLLSTLIMPNLPLHPIVVHFPIALGMTAPLFISIVWLGIYRWNWPVKTWSLVIILHAAMMISAFTAVKTGEMDEEKVERVVSEKALHDHEELGETIPWVFAGLLGLSALPLLITSKRKMFATLTLTMSFASLAPIVATGHSGGKLVYQEGAADAHVPSHQLLNTSNE